MIQIVLECFAMLLTRLWMNHNDYVFVLVWRGVRSNPTHPPPPLVTPMRMRPPHAFEWGRFLHKIDACEDVIVIYSLNKKEWICSLFKEWILEKSEIRVNLEWTFVLFTHFGVTSGITRNPWVIPVVTPKWVNNTKCSLQIHSNFTLF